MFPAMRFDATSIFAGIVVIFIELAALASIAAFLYGVGVVIGMFIVWLV